ncbi:MAG: MDR family MFS transporter, partial [Thermomicrobiales bacterium]
MVITGIGIGFTMPTFTLAVQNAFPQRQIGVVTSSVQFFRSIGATVGIAVMGSMLTSDLKSSVRHDVPPEVLNALPASALSSVNAEALSSPEAQQHLKDAFGDNPDADKLFNLLLSSLRSALEGAIHNIFVIGLCIAIVALAIVFFLPEQKLRKRGEASSPSATQSDQVMSGASS